MRRSTFDFDPHEIGNIIGAPSLPSHLPEAEPILPGHTLLRPAMGMLKSAVKFPHRELENGFGVNGNWNNLGIKWDGKNERVLYSGFRRTPAEYLMITPSEYRNQKKPSFTLSKLMLDLDDGKNTVNQVVKRLKVLKRNQKPAKRSAYFLVLATPQEEMPHQEQHYKNGNSKKYKAPIVEEILQYLLPRYLENQNFQKLKPSNALKNILRTTEDKRHWVWQNNELFNTISQNSLAVPDMAQIDLPISHHQHGKEIKPWWYYNQDDFQPFVN